MIRINLSELVNFASDQILNVFSSQDLKQIFIDKVFTDSRNIEFSDKGLFFCIKGQNFDGHDFIDQVINKGIRVFVVDNYSKIEKFLNDELGSNVTFLLTKDTVIFLGKVAKFIVQKLKRNGLKVIAVAGSAGKTSTKNILKNIFDLAGFKVIASEKSFNNEIGVPLTIFKANRDTQYLIIELGMRGFNQISYLCDISDPDYGVITSIGPEHLEFVESVRGVIKAETELTDYLVKKNSYFIIPNSIKNYYSSYHNCDYLPNKENFIKNFLIDMEKFQTRFSIFLDKKKLDFFINFVISKTFVYDFLLSLRMFKKVVFNNDYNELSNFLFYNLNDVIERSFENDRFFFEKLSNNLFVISDFYNSNYLSLNSNLKVLEQMFSYFNKAFLFIGDMLELGKFSNYYHSLALRRLVYLTEKYSGVKVFLVGDIFRKVLLKNISDNGKLGFRNIFHLDDVNFKNLDFGLGRVLVFIKGSRALKMENIKKELESLSIGTKN